MIKHFLVFNKSKLFESVWNEICDKLDKTSIATFNNIYEHVWNQTIMGCKDLLHKLYNKSFTHLDIERFANVRNITVHLTVLYDVMLQCYYPLVSSLSDPKRWIPQAAQKITMYLDFTMYSMQANSNTVLLNAVQLCFKLKELLRLKGNFSVVDNLNSQVCMYVWLLQDYMITIISF